MNTENQSTGGLWAALVASIQKASHRFDAWIGSGCTHLISAVARSPLGRQPQVQRLLRRLHMGTEGAAEEINPEYGGSPILSQPRHHGHPPGPVLTPGATRVASTGARLGLVVLVVFAVRWSWPDSPTAPVQPIELAPSLAIVNPANQGAAVLAQSPAGATTQAGGEAEPVGPSIVTAPDAAAAPLPVGATEATNSNPAVADAIADGEAAGNVIVLEPLASEEAVSVYAAGELVAAAATPGAVEIIDVDLTEGNASPRQAAAAETSAADAATDLLLAAAVPAIPAATPMVEINPEPTPDIPLVEILPPVGPQLTPTPLPYTATPTPLPSPTPVPQIVTPGRIWSNFAPKPASASDHFWIERPFPVSVGSQLASPSYQFGSTAGNRYRVHHGIDISNPMGTPVRAAAIGEVIHAGWDEPELLGPYNGFYGNTVVIRLDRRLPVAGGELDVFLLYGHLSQVTVAKGQRVQPDDIVGAVGMTGIAIGPHLHVEVRLAANTYENSVNPYLWVQPLNQAGAVALRLLTADGRTWSGARVTLARFDGAKAVWARQIETYIDTENISPDPSWGENGAMGSVPPGSYYIVGNINGERVRAELEVRSGQTTFVEIRTQQ